MTCRDERGVELEGIEPSSAERSPFALRPFPSSWLFGYHLAGSSGGHPEVTDRAAGAFSEVSGLSRRQRSFPPSSPASGARLRWSGLACHCWSQGSLRHLTRSGGESEIAVGVSFVCPV